MKKLISLLLIICILCPLLAGCVKNSSLSDELKIEIIEDYLSWSGLKGDLLAENVECTFLGKYDESVAVYFKTAGAYDVKTEETVAGYKFTYPDSRVIRVWNNGKFYKISDAYEQNLIKKRHIKSIYKESQSIVHGAPLFIWEEKVYCDYDEYRHPVYLTPDFILDAYNLTVTIDANLSRPEKIFDSEFFESIGVTEIRDATEYYSKHTTIYPNDAYRQIYHIKLAHPSSKENMKRVVSILEAKEGIKMVRPSQGPYELSGTVSSDSPDELSINWGLENIDVEKVWEFTTGSSLLRIGILDSGIASHEALNSNYSIDDALDFYNTLSTTPTFNLPNDIHSHGTHIAGIIGGLGNNEIENFGVNLNVRLTQLRALYAEDTNQAIANALNYAAQRLTEENPYRIKVINFSIGYTSIKDFLETAIINYTNAGGLLICAAGNSDKNMDDIEYREAIVELGMTIDNIIVVGAIDINNERWHEEFYYDYLDATISEGSNYGENTVDIYAPGVDIFSSVPVDYCTSNANIVNSLSGSKRRCECTQLGSDWLYTSKHIANGYHYKTGTSMAAPFVTGVAALLLSIEPDLTATELKNCILLGANQDVPITVGDGTVQYVKTLNAWGAFKYLMDNYYTYESNEIHNIDNDSNALTFTDVITSTDDYSTFKENTSFIKL